MTGTSGGSIDVEASTFSGCSIDSAVAISPPFRGGSTGGNEVEGLKVPSSLGAGLFDFDRRAAVPLARVSQDGLDLVEGFPGNSAVELALSNEDWLAVESVGEGMGLATSA